MRIALAYNQRPQDVVDQILAVGDRVRASLQHADTFVEWDEPATIEAVLDALRAFGEVIPLEAVGDFPARLTDARADLLFNMAEGLRGPSREAHVPAIAEFLGIPYTGSDPLTLAVALHKGRAKEIWMQRGVPTAPFVLVESEEDLARLAYFERYPLFLKPAWEGSSKGITVRNLVDTPEAAIERASALLADYQQPVLAEIYLSGDEFTVAVLGNGRDAMCLPIIRYRFEVLPPGSVPIVGFEAKWLWDRPNVDFDILECPAAISEDLAATLRRRALAAYDALGCRDWARVDLRLDGDGTPYVVEINPLPGVIPDPAAHSCFPRAAAELGWSHAELIQRVVQVAWQRLTGERLALPTPAAQGVTA